MSQGLLYFKGNGISPESAEEQDSDVGHCNTYFSYLLNS